MGVSSSTNLDSAARLAGREARDGVVWLGRLGYAAKGVVYLVIGGLAVAAATRASGAEEAGSTAALYAIARQPFGHLLLWLVALGLLGHVVWRLVQAGLDTERHGTHAEGLAKRAALVVSGVVYLSLAVAAARIASGDGGGGGGREEALTARLMAQPFGRWLVAVVGLTIVGVGILQLRRASTTEGVRRRLRLGELSPAQETWAVRIGRLGYAARGVTFLVIGGFLVVAGWRADPHEAGGLEGALAALERQPFGPWLLGVVGLGLAAYGVFQVAQARYLRMVVT